MKQPTFERVMYWTIYFKVMRATAGQVEKEFLEEWLGSPDKTKNAPKGIINWKEF